MLSKYVKLGDKLELESISNSRSKDELTEKKNYRSQVYDIVSEDQIKIAMQKGGIDPSDNYRLQRFEVIRYK